MPPGLRGSGSQVERRAQVLIASSLLFLSTIPPSYFFYQSLGFMTALPPVVFIGGCLIITLFVVRLTGKPTLAAHSLLLGSCLAFGWLSWETGGVNSPILWWVQCIPLIAGATLGLAASVVWTVFGALEVAVLAWLEALLMGEAFADSETRLFVVGTLYVMLATVQGFLIYSDTLREKSQSALRRSNAALRQARDEREEDIAVVAAEQVRMEAELELAESTQMKLRELHEAKSEVLRMVGHDVRSPLSEIMGATGLIKDECGDDDDSQVAVYADLILQSGDRIRDLLESILVMEQLESGLIEPNLSYADPTDIFSSTASDFKIRARAKQIEVSADLGDERPLIQTDVNMLRQVFQNLLSNAIKYSPVGGRVSISQTLEGRNVLFAIRDTGPGIPEEEYARLFLPFSKLRNRPTAGESSTGVGLAIVKSLAGRIGAVISFESDVGVGTVFYIRINLDAAE